MPKDLNSDLMSLTDMVRGSRRIDAAGAKAAVPPPCEGLGRGVARRGEGGGVIPNCGLGGKGWVTRLDLARVDDEAPRRDRFLLFAIYNCKRNEVYTFVLNNI
jgi:hypothetical protein